MTEPPRHQDLVHLTNDKKVLWNPESWVWYNPTWLINSVSVEQTGMAQQAVLLYEYWHKRCYFYDSYFHLTFLLPFLL